MRTEKRLKNVPENDYDDDSMDDEDEDDVIIVEQQSHRHRQISIPVAAPQQTNQAVPPTLNEKYQQIFISKLRAMNGQKPTEQQIQQLYLQCFNTQQQEEQQRQLHHSIQQQQRQNRLRQQQQQLPTQQQIQIQITT